MEHVQMNRSLQHISSIPGLTMHTNGSITRTLFHPSSPPNCHFDVHGVASKDVVINFHTGVWARIFLPQCHAEDPPKLPVVIYFHPGGFVVGSAATLHFHEFCEKLAKRCQVVVVSVNYRLSPEHRLPAAFNDGFEALKWLQTQANIGPVDPWLSSQANLSACYLLGHSSGGTIAHHVALFAAEDDLSPVRLEGVIMAQPFFGKNERTPSEVEFGGEGMLLTVKITDAMWALALPEGGADRDHKFCNVMGDTEAATAAAKLPGRCMVIVTGKDMLHDLQVEYVEALRKGGKEVRYVRIEEADHFTMHNEKHGEREMDEIFGFLHNNLGM